jgi:hypothetical protein
MFTELFERARADGKLPAGVDVRHPTAGRFIAVL